MRIRPKIWLIKQQVLGI